MKRLLTLLTLISLTASALAIGLAIVTNQCDDPIYIWSVGGERSDYAILSKDSTYGELYQDGWFSSGRALIVTTLPGGLFTPNATNVIFDHKLDNAFIHYDLGASFVDGVADRKISVQPKDPVCEELLWNARASSRMQICQRESILELTFCTEHCLPAWCELLFVQNGYWDRC